MSAADELRADLGAAHEPRLSAWGGGATRSTFTGGLPPRTGLVQVIHAGRSRSERLDEDVRVFLGILAVLDVVTVCIQPFLYNAVLHPRVWWQRWTLNCLAWPDPLAQPIVAGGAATVLIVLAIASAGFTRARPWHSVVLIGTSVAGALAAVPMVLFAVGWVIAIVVMIAICIAMLIFGFFMLAGD